MSPIHGLLTVVGVLLTGVGAYFLGRWWETRVSEDLHSEVLRLRALLAEMESGSEKSVQDRLPAGETESPGRPSEETVVAKPSGSVLDMLRESRVARIEMEQTGFEEPPGVTLEMDADMPDSTPRPEDMTKRISLDSADEMLALSHQVDVLTEDVARLHRELAVSRSRIVEMEDEASVRKRKNAELERRLEQLKGELARRDDKIRLLLAEVGIKADGAGLQAALDGLTARTKRVDIADIEDIPTRDDSLLSDDRGVR